MRLPDAPIGCPSAIAPPFTLQFSSNHSAVSPCSSHSCFITPIDWAAKASLSSSISISLSFMPALFNALRIAGTGPRPITAGSTPPCPTAIISTRGVRLYSFTASSLATRTKADPSLMPEAFPAVTVPSGLKAARRVASFSGDVLRFTNSSVSKVIVSFLVVNTTGTISGLNLPPSIAAAALRWEL